MKVHIEKTEMEDRYMVYLPNALKFFLANEHTIQVISKIQEGISFENLEKEIDQNNYKRICDLMAETIECKQMEIPDNILYKLVLNISNVCKGLEN